MTDQTKFRKVTFSNNGLYKLMAYNESRGGQSHSLYTPNLVELKQFYSAFASYKFSRSDIKSFESAYCMRGIDCVGYVIEKERFDKKEKRWLRIDEIKLIGAGIDKYMDARVSYGEVYRYRIRSIFKKTNSIGKVLNYNTKNSINIGAVLLELQTYYSDLKKKYQDEIILMNRYINIIVTMIEKTTNKNELLSKSITLTINNETAIYSFSNPDLMMTKLNDRITLLNGLITSLDRKVDFLESILKIDENGARVLTQEELNELRSRLSKDENVQNIFTKIPVSIETELYASMYFESPSSRKWIYVETKENQIPQYPQNFTILPDTKNKTIILSWLQPVNGQKDVNAYRLYRRRSVYDNWEKLGNDIVIDQNGNFNANICYDQSAEIGVPYIYAISSVDRHGLESFLSTQIQAELNAKYDIDKKEKPLVWVSGPGAKYYDKKLSYKRFNTIKERLIAKRRITIKPTKALKEDIVNFIIKLTSLDTHEKKEIKVILKKNKKQL